MKSVLVSLSPAQPIAGFRTVRPAMKDPAEVLRMKQKQIDQLKKEIEALRTVAGILQDEREPSPKKLGKLVQLP